MRVYMTQEEIESTQEGIALMRRAADKYRKLVLSKSLKPSDPVRRIQAILAEMRLGKSTQPPGRSMSSGNRSGE